MTIAVNTILNIESPVFVHNGFIPLKYTCDGTNVNPALIIKDLPENTESLALVVDVPDAPGGTYDHWIMWNIPPKERIEEGSAPGTQGMNSKRQNSYTGPCPPSNSIHHYHFRIFALDTKLELPPRTDKKALLKAIDDHVIASGEIVGLYKR